MARGWDVRERMIVPVPDAWLEGTKVVVVAEGEEGESDFVPESKPEPERQSLHVHPIGFFSETNNIWKYEVQLGQHWMRVKSVFSDKEGVQVNYYPIPGSTSENPKSWWRRGNVRHNTIHVRKVEEED